MSKLTETPKILLVRLSAIGDCIQTMPVATAIKSAWPRSHITWIVDCGAHSLLKQHSAVDEVFKVNKGVWGRPREAWKLIKDLRSKRFDVAIDPQGLLKSALMAWSSGAGMRIGFNSSQAREKAWWFYTHSIAAPRSHLVLKQLELIKALGIHGGREPLFGLKVDSESASFAERWVIENEMSMGRFTLVNVGAGWPSRRWPAERFAEVVRAINQKHQIPTVVVWAGQEERRLAEQVCDQSEGSARLAPETSLWQLSALIDRASLVISADTGPMHLASALGTPTVALFGPTRPEHCGPFGNTHVAIQKGTPAESREDKKSGLNRLLLRISVEEVVDACGRLLAAGEKT